MWGWGVMNQVAIQEAANIRFPMENFIGIWWSGSENDVEPVGDAANGYKALALHAAGSDFPVFADIQKYVVDAGKAAGAGDRRHNKKRRRAKAEKEHKSAIKEGMQGMRVYKQ